MFVKFDGDLIWRIYNREKKKLRDVLNLPNSKKHQRPFIRSGNKFHAQSNWLIPAN